MSSPRCRRTARRARSPAVCGTRSTAAPPSWRSGMASSSTSRAPFRPCGTCARTRRRPRRLRAAEGERIGTLEDILANTPEDGRNAGLPWLLAPIDLQAIKAAGVTFAISMLERVIEERARGDLNAAASDPGRDHRHGGRGLLEAEARLAGSHAAEIGADRAGRLVAISRSRHRTRRRDLHQGARDVGGRARARTPASTRNRPGTIRSPRWCWRWRRTGASSARRSATTSTCAISRAAPRCCSARPRTTTRAARSGRSCRFFDGGFTLDHVRAMELHADRRGPGRATGSKASSSMSKISRDPADLVGR